MVFAGWSFCLGGVSAGWCSCWVVSLLGCVSAGWCFFAEGCFHWVRVSAEWFFPCCAVVSRYVFSRSQFFFKCVFSNVFFQMCVFFRRVFQEFVSDVFFRCVFNCLFICFSRVFMFSCVFQLLLFQIFSDVCFFKCVFSRVFSDVFFQMRF